MVDTTLKVQYTGLVSGFLVGVGGRFRSVSTLHFAPSLSKNPPMVSHPTLAEFPEILFSLKHQRLTTDNRTIEMVLF